MNVLVDTDVWSEAFRKRVGEASPQVKALDGLIRDGRVQLIGPIRQEVLSGLRSREQAERIHLALRAFPDRVLDSALFEQGAEYFNLCRSNGIQGSNTDFLICACSVSWSMPILSKDHDYEQYRKWIPLTMH